MVKLRGPLFSFDASGTVGDAITFSKWKGRPYARQRVIPSNPKTPGQVAVRAMLRFLTQAWAGLGTTPKGSWATAAAQSAISNFNAYVGENQMRFREYLAPTQQSPAAEALPAPSAPVTTPSGGVHHTTLSIADGATPPQWGWMIHRGLTGFTPAYSNVIAVIPRTATPTVYTDSPLTAGTYYYRIRGFSSDGVMGTLEAERSAIAT